MRRRIIPHNDHDTPSSTCPTCGRPLPPPFDPTTSGLLDLVLIAKDALHEVQTALEQEVLP
jgi:hypothetical protein